MEYHTVIVHLAQDPYMRHTAGWVTPVYAITRYTLSKIGKACHNDDAPAIQSSYAGGSPRNLPNICNLTVTRKANIRMRVS